MLGAGGMPGQGGRDQGRRDSRNDRGGDRNDRGADRGSDRGGERGGDRAGERNAPAPAAAPAAPSVSIEKVEEQANIILDEYLSTCMIKITFLFLSFNIMCL